MLEMDKALYLIAVYCVVREVWFHYQLNKLLNKAMSQDYYSYKVADSVQPRPHGQTMQAKDDVMEEDLNHVLG